MAKFRLAESIDSHFQIQAELALDQAEFNQSLPEINSLKSIELANHQT